MLIYYKLTEEELRPRETPICPAPLAATLPAEGIRFRCGPPLVLRLATENYQPGEALFYDRDAVSFPEHKPFSR